MANPASSIMFRPGVGSWTGDGLAFGPSAEVSGVTFGEFAQAWLSMATGRQPRTIEVYRYRLEQHVLPSLGNLPLAEIGPDDILRLLRDLERRGYSAWTVRSVTLILKVVFQQALVRDLVVRNPFHRIERGALRKPEPAQRRVLNCEEISALLRATPPRHNTLLTTAIFTGLRQSELLALRWEHVDSVRGVIRVRTALNRQQKHVPLKTGAAIRDVVAPERLLQRLQQELRHSRFAQPTDYVFPSRVGTPLHWRNTSRRILKPALNRAGLPNMRWHDFRHTYASILIAGGANLLFVSRQMGHAHPEITLRLYGDLFGIEEQGQRARAALEELMPIG